MARTVGLGIQDFEDLVTKDCFYIDKTMFIKEWWENQDAVTLITRPRRFGKTLNMNMVERFFSVRYAGKGDVFEGLSIWEDEDYRSLQGRYPVIALSFADVKETDHETARRKICKTIEDLYQRNRFILDSGMLEGPDRDFFQKVSIDMGNVEAAVAIRKMSDFLSHYHGKKVIILLDEYDTPLQEAYVCGYWDEMVSFTRSLFNSTFKTNPYLERALLTGITRISKESMFSDLNNLEVVTTTSEKYADSFGFTRQEVWNALERYGLSGDRDKVLEWYDGFTFGKKKEIYNPWSIANYLDKRRIDTYWVNTSSNSLAGKLIREGNAQVKKTMEDLLEGKTFQARIDEQIVFDQLDQDENAVWSLLLASGYLRVEHFSWNEEWGCGDYDLALTNREVRVMFRNMIKGWFADQRPVYNAFVGSLLSGDLDGMNEYMNEITAEMFSVFDTGKRPSAKTDPERFYHGFVLGLLVDLRGRYTVTSNRESGFGRYDVVLEPLEKGMDAVIIEFKVFRPTREASLEDTVKAALAQIETKGYATGLLAKGIPEERIRRYGFAFEGKKVLIGRSQDHERSPMRSI